MKQLFLKNRTLLLVLAAIAVLIGVYLIAQDADTEEQEQDCRWRMMNLAVEGHSVSAVQWNDCTGETKQLYRSSLESDNNAINVRTIISAAD